MVLLLIISNSMANRVDPDQTPHSAAPDLTLYCFLMSYLWDMRHKCWCKWIWKAQSGCALQNSSIRLHNSAYVVIAYALQEPTAGLSLKDSLELMQILSNVAKTRQLAAIISTSYPNSSWLRLCNKVTFLSSEQVRKQTVQFHCFFAFHGTW